MIKIRTPEIGDLKKIRPKGIYQSEDGWQQMILRHELSDMYTICWDDQVLLITGFQYIWPEVVQCWALVGQDLDDHGISATLALRRFLEKRAKAHGVHRMQITVQSKYAEGVKWARSLGFEPESRMFRFGRDRQDYNMMVRQF